MSLFSTVENIKNKAKAQPNVGLVYEGDIYDLNEKQNISYPAVVATQATHAESGDFRAYGFNLFYVDRLTADKSNRLEIQSTAIEALSNIAKALEDEGYEISELRYHSFDERFDAECAGVYVEITISESEYMCEEKY